MYTISFGFLYFFFNQIHDISLSLTTTCPQITTQYFIQINIHISKVKLFLFFFFKGLTKSGRKDLFTVTKKKSNEKSALLNFLLIKGS